eukprot:scaffold44353_cov48-Phaeocystis_antarctica.AAC.1
MLASGACVFRLRCDCLPSGPACEKPAVRGEGQGARSTGAVGGLARGWGPQGMTKESAPCSPRRFKD